MVSQHLKSRGMPRHQHQVEQALFMRHRKTAWEQCQSAGQAQHPPRRTLLSSRTSSCTRLAVWIISTISAKRLCCSVMSLQPIEHFQNYLYLTLEGCSDLSLLMQKIPFACTCTRSTRRQKHYCRPKLLATCSKNLVSCLNQQWMPATHYATQIGIHSLHISFDWP